ncbi:MAG: GNAT family N-acetyltransferase [Anaerolineae bacterium]
MSDTASLVSYQLDGLAPGRSPFPAAPPPGITLRRADLAADLPAMVELCRASFQAASSVAGDDEVAACAELADLLRHPGLAPPGAFLALDGDLFVGLGVGRVEVPARGEGTRRAAIELLAVRPGYRRRGLARALLGRLLAWLAARGVDTVVASTEDPVVAAMLERHGFRA